MTSQRRTQADRSAATRDALIRAARPLFAAHGFAGVGTEAIVRAAGVTRGAMYHHFQDKTELFAAVFEVVEAEVTQRVATVVLGGGSSDPLEVMLLGTDAWLDACADPEVQRIVLLEAPSVLGWERWREIGLRYGMGLVQASITGAIDAGALPDQPVEAAAHVVIGALDEAAMYVARAADPARAREEVRGVLKRLVNGLSADDDAVVES